MHLPKRKKLFWESTARDKAKFVKEEKEEDEEVERRRMKMEVVQQEKSRQQEGAAVAAAVEAAAARVAATAAFFKALADRAVEKEAMRRWYRDRSRSRQRKFGLPTPEQLPQ